MLDFKFTTKFLLVSLGVLLLTQYTLSKVIPQTTVHAIELQDVQCKLTLPKEHAEKFQKLTNFTFEELEKFEKSTLNLLKNFFDKIIATGAEDKKFIEKLEPFKKIDQELAEKERKTDATLGEVLTTEEKAKQLLDEYSATSRSTSSSSSSSSIIKDHADKEAELIIEILHKIGVDSLKKEFDEAAKGFIADFARKVDEYRKSLTAEERNNDKSFDNWYTKFNAEQDHCKKMQHFNDFFELYCGPIGKSNSNLLN